MSNTHTEDYFLVLAALGALAVGALHLVAGNTITAILFVGASGLLMITAALVYPWK